MNAPLETVADRALQQGAAELTTPADREMKSGVPPCQPCQRIDEMHVSLHRVEVADRYQQPIARYEPELVAQGDGPGRDIADTVRNREHLPERHAQIRAEMTGQWFGDRHCVRAGCSREPHREAPPESVRVDAAAVHRDDVRNPEAP